MAAVWYRFRVELRSHWVSLLAITLLVALASGAVFTALAGARRTATLADRYESETRSNDVFVELEGDTADPALLDELEALPQVEALGRLAPAAAFPATGYIPFVAPVDGRVGRTIDRYPIITGRHPDPHAPNEVLLSEDAARQLRAEVGSRIRLRSYAPEQTAFLEDEDVAPLGPRLGLTVAGIARTGPDLAQRPGDVTMSLLTPAFYERHRDDVLMGVNLAAVRLRDEPHALQGFTRGARRLAGTGISVEPADSTVEGLKDSFAVLATGLAAFAAVAVAAALVALAVVFGRLAFLTSVDDPTLSAMGLTRPQRALAGGGLSVPIAVVGTILGTIGALVASRWMPIGLAGRAEPSPGFDVDLLVLVLGAAIALVLVIGLGLATAWIESGRATRAAHAGRPAISRLAGRHAARLGPAAGIGVRMALEPGRRRTAVPVRAALTGTVAGLAAVTGVLGFGAALDRLVDTPARYGWGWDVNVGDDVGSGSRGAAMQRALERDPDVEAVAVGRFQVPLLIDGRPVRGLGIRNLTGEINPTIVEGDPARSTDEVVLGTDTLDRIGAGIGDRVDAEGPAGTRRLRVVGRAVFPVPEDPIPIADGAALTYAGLDALGLADGTGDDSSFAQTLVRWKPGTDEPAARARIRDELGVDVEGPRAPPEVEKLVQVDQLPKLLAGLLAVLALLAVGYAVVTAVHRRRRDLAILKTLGFRRGQVASTVAWQASTLGVIGALVGVPLGLIVARWTWGIVADGLGVATDPAVPIVALVLAVPATLLFANAVAFLPGRIAAATRPAAVLRAE